MVFPAFALYGIERMGWMPASFYGITLIQMTLFAIKLYLALPLGISAFPPIGHIKSDQFVNDSVNVQS